MCQAEQVLRCLLLLRFAPDGSDGSRAGRRFRVGSGEAGGESRGEQSRGEQRAEQREQQ